MPSGYTDYINKGVSFDDFVLICARAFGALINMKEDSFDKPIPKRLEPSSYHKDELEKEEVRLESLLKMSNEQGAIEAKAEWKEAMAYYEERLIENKKQKEGYESMLAKVRDWTPPTEDHRGLKQFMIEQITQSISFDCSYEPDKPSSEPSSGAEWLKLKIKNAKEDIKYHSENYTEEVARIEERNKWIEDLRGSLYKES